MVLMFFLQEVWVSSISGYDPEAYARSIPFNNNDVNMINHSGRSGGYSVRCVKDD